MSVKELKGELAKLNIDFSSCLEKEDLVNKFESAQESSVFRVLQVLGHGGVDYGLNLWKSYKDFCGYKTSHLFADREQADYPW